MPSLTEKPWFIAVCIPIAILGTSALVGAIMLSTASETVGKKTKYLKDSIEAIQKSQKQLADKIEELDQKHHLSNEKHVHWSHDTKGVDGPAYWGELGYKIADQGIRQSPIDINSTSAITSPGLDAIDFRYGDTEFTIKNNGHTIQVDCAGSNNTITINDHEYALLQFHFHARSEHKIDGKPYPMELHFVHILNPPDWHRNWKAWWEHLTKHSQTAGERMLPDRSAAKLAVVGVMIVEGPPNPLIDKLWEKLPKSKDDNASSITGPGLNIDDLLPPDGQRSFFRYSGSLTTPPCTENVLWSVMKEPIPFSKEQIEAFTKLYKKNNRPTQRVHQRSILRYSDALPSSTAPTPSPVASVLPGLPGGIK